MRARHGCGRRRPAYTTDQEDIDVQHASRTLAALAAVVIIAGSISACGSSTSSNGSTATTAAGPASGPGLTQPTQPSGARVSGGTVYWTEQPDLPPNYIFPMYSSSVCSTANAAQFLPMMFRPLYWFGNNYRPTVDYSYSVGGPPQFSGGGHTVTIHLKDWKWSDGEPVTARDLVFWMNLMKADPATEWCAYVPGYFPDNVTSYSAPDPHTFVLHFTKAYNPTWLLYNELSQLTPIPLAWDRTSLSQSAPTSDNGHLPDSTKAGAAGVYKFLDAQARDLGSWASSPLWRVVDGPFRLQSITSTGQATLVPNPDYSGTPKPTISKFVELPFTSDTAIFNQLRSGGPSSITIGNVPPQYAPQITALASEGYVDNKAASYSFNYFPLNLNSSAATSPGGEPVRFVFKQLYFRQAFQHLIDQTGWVHAFLHDTANPTYSPVPPSPPSPLVNASLLTQNPYPFSVSAAAQLLSSHGWKVVPGGSTTCQKPSLCGPGIKQGEGISFNIDYASGTLFFEQEMDDLASLAKKVGINVSLTTHPFNTVIKTSAGCIAPAAPCAWTAENWGAGWIYAPSFLPTGEVLFLPGAAANYSSYSNPATTKLIDEVPLAANEKQALTAYEQNVERMLPVVFEPTSIGTYAGDAGTVVAKDLGGYAANAMGYLTPESWYFAK
jgi:peptide/nickel transport system substrate-binding protein